MIEKYLAQKRQLIDDIVLRISKMFHSLQALKCLERKDLFNWDQMNGINLDLLLLVMNTVLFGSLLVLIEKNVFRSMKTCVAFTKKQVIFSEKLDDDVETERKRVLNNNHAQRDDLLTVTNLQKRFGSFQAVQGLNFGVKHGECFGFLGINGAGKTTSFKCVFFTYQP